MLAFQGTCFVVLIVVYYSTGGTSEEVTVANVFSLHLIVGKDRQGESGFIFAYDAINMLTNFLLIA